MNAVTRTAAPRRIGVLSTGRQDWGILRSTCRWISLQPELDLRLLVGGMACSDRFGRVETAIAAEGFAIADRLPWLDSSGSVAPHAEAGMAVTLLGEAFARHGLDALLLVGDRYETLAAAMVATVQRIPLVHLHGGEETEGAFDNAIRHSITKLAHLHLTSHPAYAARVIAMGEDPATVHVVGAPGLDNLRRSDLATREELEQHLGLPLIAPVVVVTVHPTTLGAVVDAEVEAVCQAMDALPATYVITLPNSDPGNELLRERLLEQATRKGTVAVTALGERRYWALLSIADAMLGNSSSGVIEAPALALPAVNVGDRQKGRLRSAAIIDVRPEAVAVRDALRTVLASGFRETLRAVPPLFGYGDAATEIGRLLLSWRPSRPPIKRFTHIDG